MSGAERGIPVTDQRADLGRPFPVLARVRLSRDLSDGRYGLGDVLRACDVAEKYDMNDRSVFRVLSDLQALGMITPTAGQSVVVCSAAPKQMQEAYEIRAALEEIGGRAAAPALKGNTRELRCELDAMRVAVRNRDLDAYVEHDVKFHHRILGASENDLLLRIWDSLSFDIRLRAVIGKVSGNLPEVVESHQSIINELENGHGKEAGLLLRNHAETFLQFLRKAERDSGIHLQLEIARNVQEAFFPERCPSIPGLSCHTFYKPAHAVGGDYYDFLLLHDAKWGIAIGDVSGKGIGAALMMASLQASVRAQALHSASDVAELIDNVNQLVHDSSPDYSFASLFYAEYQPATRTLEYVNAGHCPPIVLRQSNGACEVHELNAVGPPVGMLPGSQYTSTTFHLEVADYVVAYTDGITEAQRTDDELWGQRRLETLLCSCRHQTPQQVVRRIVDQVSAFAVGGKQSDDMTLVVMQVQEGTED